MKIVSLEKEIQIGLLHRYEGPDYVTIHAPVKVLEDCLKEHADNLVSGKSSAYKVGNYDDYVYLYFPVSSVEGVK